MPMSPLFRSQATTNQSGEFASARIYLTDPLSLIGGARISSNRLSNTVSVDFPGFVSAFTQVVKDDDKVTPFAGITYDVNTHYSLYGSYADIYQTNRGFRKIGGALLSPADGIDRELGLKGSWRNGTLNGLLVLYDIDQRGLGVVDQGASIADQQAFPLCCFLPNGTNKSKGADVELNGAFTDGWLIGAGYTFNINHYYEGGDLSSATPRHLLKLWSSMQLPGNFQRWTIGGSLKAQSSNFAGGFVCPHPDPTGNCVQPLQFIRDVQGAFAKVDLRAGYQIDAHWRAALSISNVFDRTYYQTIGMPSGGNWYGEPRGFRLRVDGNY
jgi:outer membrane receptor for ferric coprogen and ferric-rhodotorulic acid